MNPQFKIAFPATVLSLILFVPLAHAQRGGMRGGGGGFHGGSVGGFRGGAVRANRGGGEFNRQGRRGFEDGFGFPFAPFYYPDYFDGGFYDGYYDSDLDYRDPAPLDPPVQTRMPQVYQSPAPPSVPGDSLILENHDGRWVRIPTGGELVNAATPPGAGAVPAPSPKAPGIAPKTAETEPPGPPLPPAVLVFRDGHTVEIQKYMIQGADLYASSAYSATGTWTQKIPLSDLDIPVTLKINKDRGTKFYLPSGPNEVVVRF
ncbi:MAG TPA: hypothetical protein VK709_16225 [Candidatus Saccharimonadales bacterium]|jgi:hypothetical protein|nr:hypothetical protein [Candidatus Saccharimonadales bacterium]